MAKLRLLASAMLFAIALFGCTTKQVATNPLPQAASGIDWANAPSLTIILSDFDFTPMTPKLKQGQPVRLILVNQGSGKHDFSAPAFFATAALRPGSVQPVGGGVMLEEGQKAEIDVVPRAAGTYKLECTVFLHAMFGMTGTISVTSGSN